MKPACARLLLAITLTGFPLFAQDATTLQGEPAIRFLAGHGHLTSYCEGQLTVTPTRVQFVSLTSPRHSFDFKRDEINDLHPASALGFHYVKLSAAGKTYRMPLYPDLEHAFGDRLAFFAHAYRDFHAAFAEVERVRAARQLPAGVAQIRDNAEGPVLELPAIAGMGVLWFKGPKGVTVWSDGAADAGAYGRIVSVAKSAPFARGRLEITAERVRFISAGADGDARLAFDAPKSDIRLNSGAGGYPRVVVNVRYTGRLSLLVGGVAGDGLKLYDATPLLRALGPEFAQVVEELRQAAARGVR